MPPEPASVATEVPPADPGRLREIFVAHHRFIWRLLRRFGLPTEAADDLTQQTFLIAAERLADIKRGSERSFLYGTAIRLQRDLRRAELRMVRDSGHSLESATPSVEERIDEGRALALLDRVLAEMDADLRDVFVLFELERFPTHQIAELCGIPAGTAASRLRRAREDFRVRSQRLSRPRKVGGT